MRKIVVTGGAGFAGSHIVDELCRTRPDVRVLVFDKMTYAGDVRNIAHHLLEDRIGLLVGDVAHLDACRRAVEGADLVIHAAAESHVDHSFGNSLEFTRTNVLGTHTLMEACRQAGVPRIIHVSTDEVYGEVMSGAVDEQTILRPTNPYSSSKAAAEMILRGYIQSYRVPILIVRANNLYGVRQYPEKIIPRFLCHMLTGRRLPIHGSGCNRRHYLSTTDFARAILFLAERGEVGETYNIGTEEEYTNLEVAGIVAAHFGKRPEEVIDHVADRPFNDARYSISWSKLAAMGWRPENRLRDDIGRLTQWYSENLNRYSDLFGAPA
ncbi:MAG: GDP-mannose 4,6-dehydratase [Rhodocyclaceae bacterium]|jgi:UDP-glucose 4,6-dehydratase|nr:GDP-mannose 4,6-dehydratase [Rhodocyclaceae bacterium]MCL4757786.1 GDP-mannose 4,6-dehydratase [Rhodocyclaceae bacterium]